MLESHIKFIKNELVCSLERELPYKNQARNNLIATEFIDLFEELIDSKIAQKTQDIKDLKEEQQELD